MVSSDCDTQFLILDVKITCQPCDPIALEVRVLARSARGSVSRNLPSQLSLCFAPSLSFLYAVTESNTYAMTTGAFRTQIPPSRPKREITKITNTVVKIQREYMVNRVSSSFPKSGASQQAKPN